MFLRILFVIEVIVWNGLCNPENKRADDNNGLEKTENVAVAVAAAENVMDRSIIIHIAYRRDWV